MNTYYRSSLYPSSAKTEYNYSITNFGGGLNNVNSSNIIADNQSVDCMNMTFDSVTSMRKRGGIKLEDCYVYNEDIDKNVIYYDVNSPYYLERPIGALTYVYIDKPITYFSEEKYYTYSDVDNQIVSSTITRYIFATDDTLYVVDPSIKKIITQFSVNGRVNGARYNDAFFFTDGTNLYSYYDVCTKISIDSTYTDNEFVHGFRTVYGDPKFYVQDGQIKGDNVTTGSFDAPANSRFAYVSDRATFGINRINVQNNYLTEYDDTKYSFPLYIAGFETDPETQVVTATYELINVRYYFPTNTWDSSYNGYKKTKFLYELSTSYDSDKLDNYIFDNEILNPVIRSYKPNDITYYVGNTIIENHCIWYEPCMNELNDALSGENVVPNKPSNVFVYNGSLCVVGDVNGDNILFMSQQGNPYYFPASHTFVLERNGDNIVDMFVFDNSLVIGRNHDIFVLYGDSVYSKGNPYYLKKIDAHTGLACPNCGSLINNYYVYFGYDGNFYRLNSPATYNEYLMTKPLSTYIDVSKSPLNINDPTNIDMSSAVYKGEVWFSFNTAIPLIIVYSFDNMAFTYFKGMNSSYLFSNDHDMFVCTKNGYISKYDKDFYRDIDTNYTARFLTKNFDFGKSVYYKYFKQIKLNCRVDVGLNSIINVKCINNENSNFNTVFSFTTEESQDYFHSKWNRISFRARNIQFDISNNIIDQPMQVYELSVPYMIRDLR